MANAALKNRGETMIKDAASTNDEFSEMETAILAFIPNGMERPRPLNELTMLVVGKDSLNERRKVRDLINHLVVVHHIPIGARYTKPNGYYIATNDHERDLAIEPLISQVVELERRIQSLVNTDFEQNKKPAELETYHNHLAKQVLLF